MKKQFLTLIVLLLLGGATSAWGADSAPTFTQPSATLDLQADGLATTLSGISWNSRDGNVSHGYELTADYLVLPLQTLGYTCPSWCVKENFNNNKGTWSASTPFKADSYFFSTTGSEKNNVIKVTTTRPVAVKVTNCTGAYVYAATGSNYTILNVYEVTNNTDKYNTFTKVKTANTNSNAVVNVTGLTASKTYIVEVIGATTSNANAYAIALNRAALSNKPTITTQPTSATYESGDDATALTVAATASAGVLSYQWYKNTDGDVTGKEGDKIDGATSATLAAATISTSSAGTTYYYCIVTDGNGSSTSDKATITVVNVIAPEISYSNATNTVTISCEGSGTIYYTLDNSAPTSSSTAYSAPFVLTNTSTVRAVAIKSENASVVISENCYVDHSDVALAVLNYTDDANVSEKIWTSTDALFTLTAATNNISWYTIFSGKDGFKLNANESYTLQSSSDIKITSVKVIGKSRSDATNPTTLSITGFTPASGTFEKGQFVKTIEYTPSAELGFGQPITITPSGNQFGAYIEVYGVKRGMGTVSGKTSTTWDFSSAAAQTTALNGATFTESAENTLYNTTQAKTIVYSAGSGDELNSSGYLKSNGTTSDSNKRYFILQIDKNGALQLFSKSTFGTYVVKKAATSSTSWSSATEVTTITTTTEGTGVSANITYDKDKPYLFIGLSSKAYTQKIVWTPTVPSYSLPITSAYWASLWLPFAAIIPDGATVYYAKAASTNTNTVTLTPITGVIPAGTGVVVKGTPGETYAFTEGSTNVTINDNLFAGDDEAVSVPANTDYVLKSGDDNSCTFALFSGTSIAAYRAYLLGKNVSTPAPSIHFVIDEENNATNVETIEANDKAVKFIQNGQLLILRDGITYDAMGRVVR